MAMPKAVWRIGQTTSFHCLDIIRFCIGVGKGFSIIDSTSSSISSIAPMNSVMSIIPLLSESICLMRASISSPSNSPSYSFSRAECNSSKETWRLPSLSRSLNIRWAEMSCSSMSVTSVCKGLATSSSSSRSNSSSSISAWVASLAESSSSSSSSACSSSSSSPVSSSSSGSDSSSMLPSAISSSDSDSASASSSSDSCSSSTGSSEGVSSACASTCTSP